MRRHWLSKPAGLLLALLFVLVVGEPGIIDACPLHGNISLLVGNDAPTEAGHAADHHGSAPTDEHHSNKDCNCLGCCTGSVAVALLPTAPVVEFSVIRPATAIVGYELASVSTGAPPHSRPFSTGPPRA